MIPAPFGTAMVYLGPCTIISPFSCHIGHSAMMNAQTYSIYIVAVSFFYRLYILKHNAPTQRTMAGICFIMMVLPVCMFTLTFLTIDSETEVREAFRVIYNLDYYVVQGHLASHSRKVIKISTIYNAGSCLPVTIIVFIVRSRVLATLKQKHAKMSVKSLQIHRILVKVLTLQACLPALYTLTIICYFIGKHGLLHSPINEHAIRVFCSLSKEEANCKILTYCGVALFAKTKGEVNDAMMLY
ncbi:hypothetical protein PRIPAC_80266, partial [Pristionchus pacificus]|uniref:G protein-coupled receptor n=1 Tax=Pristionchus pacificus TaxID=54126 RepID=A0A2A6CNW8_PRIPA